MTRRGTKAGRFVRLVTAGVLGAVLTLVSAPPAGAEPAGPVQNDFLSAMLYSVAHPRAFPTGANEPGCRPGPRHPRPVVLVNGTLENAYANWSRLSPRLRSDGYCVFAFNYGGVDGSPFQQLGPMRASARQLAAFVDHVRAVTGARRVDLVGHSQGGLLPLHYINRLGGRDTVHHMIGVEPASRGVHGYGLLTLIGRTPGLSQVLSLPCAACADATADSPFLRETAEGGYTRPEVRYTTIISRTDGVVTVPEAQLPPAPGVTNIVTQDVCPLDLTDHVNAVYDDITLRLVRNALDPATAVPPGCHVVLPLLPPQH
ncbi:triacylglycerol lipase [Streptomyces sp. UNOB3_S3]|uniref:esterase/lipase family protein n=1 Tax=Streptomyces sp. UNOB3_S3 TaxID=2871682 RepID=UPI001E65721B|nr:alpha/beta fold hydrolase [Streptomyces sp. UNOB3_S3]MCC3776497.1 alpha/beta fold hydrolase [Streptomyces sp. UNOB3_S3]